MRDSYILTVSSNFVWRTTSCQFSSVEATVCISNGFLFVDPGLDQFVDIKFENPGFLTSVADNLIKRHSADASFLLFLRPLLRALDVVVNSIIR